MPENRANRDWIISDPLTVIDTGVLYFCLEYRTVEVCGQEIELTAKEFDIFALLILNPRRVFTYEMIMEIVWNEPYNAYSRKTIINHISNLRRKLKIHPEIPDYIKSVYGVGYKFDKRIKELAAAEHLRRIFLRKFYAGGNFPLKNVLIYEGIILKPLIRMLQL